MLADQHHHVAHHVGHRVARVRVFLTAPKHGIDQKAAPRHLKWRKALDLLVGRLHPVADLCLVVVHHHSVDAKAYDLRPLDLETPHEELQQQPPEQPDPRPAEGPEKTFHRVRRRHVRKPDLDGSGVALVPLEFIEVHQVATRAVHEETAQLVQEADDSKSLRALAHSTEKANEVGKDPDVVQVAAEQSQATPTGQGVGSNADGIETGLLSVARSARRGYGFHTPFGLRAAHTAIVDNFFDTNNLTQRVLLVQTQNRSI